MGLRDRLLPPLVEVCPRCKGSAFDPEEMDEERTFYEDCRACLGVGRVLTKAGRAVLEAVEVGNAVIDAKVSNQLDARYGANNPLDPRASAHCCKHCP